jgi:DNA-binding response OmpR family regulator
VSSSILLVEDDSALSFLIGDRLHQEGYSVSAVPDGEQALEVLQLDDFDAVLLDVMLPGRSGFDVCRELRSLSITLPILMLTARGEVTDRVTGLKLGADDYLAKPFEIAELLARLEALLRRSRMPPRHSRPNSFQFADVSVDFVRQRVRRGNARVELSNKEFQLLRHLVQNEGRVVSRDELLTRVWGYQALPYTRTVDFHMAQLRKKLENDPQRPVHFQTVRGAGYCFTEGEITEPESS